MAKKSNISILNPIVRKNIREEEEKIGRKLTRQEKHKFIQNNKRQIKRNFIKGSIIIGLASFGITLGAKAMLPEPKDNTSKIEQNENKSKAEQFRKGVQYDVEPINIEEMQDQEDMNKQIASQYNTKYNEDLLEENIGYIKTSPRFLTIDKNGNYSFDSSEKTEFEESIPENKLGDMYVVVNKQNKEIISAVGEAKLDVVNVDVKKISVGQTEYTNSSKMIDLTVDENGNEKSAEEKDEIYSKVKSAYEERLKEREKQEGQEIGED